MDPGTSDTVAETKRVLVDGDWVEPNTAFGITQSTKKMKADSTKTSLPQEVPAISPKQKAILLLDEKASSTLESHSAVAKEQSLELAGKDDRRFLTDYYFYLMKQLRPCDLGALKGMECTHCAFERFWINLSYKPFSFDPISSHVFECQSCPKDVKDALQILRDSHPEQLLQLPWNAIQIFSHGLFRRLVIQRGGSSGATLSGRSSAGSTTRADWRRLAVLARNAKSKVHLPGPFLTTANNAAKALVSSSTRDSEEILKIFGEDILTSIKELFELEGIGNVFEFRANPFMHQGNGVFDRFLEALLSKGESPVELVFHGTRRLNIEAIQKDGLNPKFRTGQAFGVGEYFNRQPGLSLSYCRGDGQMLVFAVIVPDRCRIDGKDAGGGTQQELEGRNCRRRPPPGMVVVPTTDHQIPIGVVTFDPELVDKETQSYSDSMAKELARLHEEFLESEKKEKDAETKAQIIQLLIQGMLEDAGRKFDSKKDLLSDTSKCEISMFAHRRYEKGVVAFFFPDDLPPPLKYEDYDLAVRPLSVEDAKKQARAAKSDYDRAMAQSHDGLCKAYKP